MTIEQANQNAQAAAAAGNLEQLRAALEARAAAIAEIPVTAENAPRLQAALEAGESIARDLRLLKLKIGIDAHRLAQIQSALLAGLGAPPHRRIDFRG
jgi:hypothetical protein